MVLKEGAKALLGNLASEQGAHGMASAHNVGTTHGLLQLLAGAEADALDLDVVVGDAVFKVFYWCPIKLFLENKKLGLVPFGGISPFWLFWFYHKLL